MALLVALPGQAPAATPPAPLADVLPAGAVVAPPQLGLAFVVSLLDDRTLLTDHFEMTISGVPGKLRVRLEGATVSDGVLSADVLLTNDTEAALSGLRLDVTGASERYRAPGSGEARPSGGSGSVTRLTRDVKIAPVAPFLVGGLRAGAHQPAFPLRVEPLAFSAATEVVTVLATLSGVAEVGSLSLEGVTDPRALATDERDRFLVADGSAPRVVQLTTEINDVRDFVKLASEPFGLAVGQRGGRVAVTRRGGQGVAFFWQGGAAAGALPNVSELGTLRFAGRDLYAAARDAAGGVVRVLGEPTGRIALPALAGLAVVKSFDVDAAGRIWLLGEDPPVLWLAERRTSPRRVETAAATWLGAERRGVACRLDADGHLLVAEGGAGHAAVLTEVDSQGRVVRAWPLEPAGSAMTVRDLAITHNGRLAVLEMDGRGGPAVIRLFRRF